MFVNMFVEKLQGLRSWGFFIELKNKALTASRVLDPTC